MKRRSRETTTFDLTPLIDVVFLMLIFFMVSTVFKKDELALLLNLPEIGESSENQKNLSLIIELGHNRVAVSGKKTTLNKLKENLKDVQNKKDPLEIRIDKDVPYERVMKLFDILKKEGLNNFSLSADSK
mgnify:CR=1 FL=1